ncbi:glucosamine-6-phosphate deaminase [Pseudalkalibacillus hwajinpoensis]|uniref:Glucosamine-6-phosphate deaminase n=1 Tax=Guptibacillus hwajinpoensis TaxID=208199 RepID=A0A4U1MBM6_9BACL|nr:glucosamine-6-phosphate deaminase [Pseudalkalibacillus hwajinpoensis]TKD67702.1 glucosamine-6-phosphate deaminase [Pseudalkalibacillus hwajinpoensis]
MRIIEAIDYEHMSSLAARFLIDKISTNPELVLGLATGGTPRGTYKRLIEDHRMNGTSYKEITTYNLDEYVGFSPDNPNSYHTFMSENLFSELDIQKNNIHLPNGVALDLVEECKAYEERIEKTGGIDIQLLGMGSNGHIGFNEPGTSFEANTHLVELTQSTREANARFFNHIDDVPHEAITMGIATIMRSREILLLVSGETKRSALKELLSGDVRESFPASVLNRHPHVTIIADQKAL